MAYAVSSDASEWNGNYESTVAETDFFVNGANYYIYTAKGFAHFAKRVNEQSGFDEFYGKTIYLETDIDLAGKEWTPINNFNGRFNGQGHYIYNLTQTKTTSYTLSGTAINVAGLFGVLGTTGSISDIHLRNVEISASTFSKDYYVGGLVGYAVGNERDLIQNSSVKGNITVPKVTGDTAVLSDGGYVGGIAGAVSTRNRVSNLMSVVEINTKTQNANIGGIFGASLGTTLTSVYSESNISFDSGNVGGLVGYVAGSDLTSISNSYNKGILTFNGAGSSRFRAGGLVGQAETSIAIQNGYNAGALNINSFATNKDNFSVGGLVGYVNVGNASATLRNSFMLGEIYNGSSNRDYLFVNNSSSTQILTSNLYYENGKESLYGSSIDNLNQYARALEFYKSERLSDWNIGETWEISVGLNDSLPYLVNAFQMGSANNDKNQSSNPLKGSGTANNPYMIETAGDLAWLSQYCENNDTREIKYYALQNDIDLAGRTWIPIGRKNAFNGVFDGNNFTISGLNCSLQESFSEAGLFAKTGNAVIKNLKVKDYRHLDVLGASSAVGSIVASVQGETYLINCADTTGYNSVGEVGNGNLHYIQGQNGTLKLTGGLASPEGYDLTFDGQGGTFYDVNSNVYRGKYHLLISNGVILQPKIGEDGAVIDTTYGKSVPELSTSLGEKDVLIKRGYKLNGFRDERGTAISFQSIASARTLYANWQGGSDGGMFTETVRVVYNQYEKDNFRIKESNIEDNYLDKQLYYNDTEIAGTVFGKTEDGLVYVEHKLIYDSMLNEYPELLVTPQYIYGGAQKLRNGDFEVAGVYYDYNNGFQDVDSVELSSLTFINDNFDAEEKGEVRYLYADWKGVEEMVNEYSVTLKISKAESRQWNGYDKFSLKDAFKGNEKYVSLSGGRTVGEDEEIRTNFTVAVNAETDDYIELVYSYNTLYSDKLDNWLKFVYDLKFGYATNITTLSDSLLNIHDETNTKKDGNFGELATNRTATNLNEILIYNLIGNYTIEIEVYRDNITTSADFGPGVSYGLSPKYVLTEGTSLAITKYTASTGSFSNVNITALDLSAHVNEYLALDFAKNKLMFSSNVFLDDEFALPNEAKLEDENDYLIFAYTTEGTTTYFKYILENKQTRENAAPIYYVSLYKTAFVGVGLQYPSDELVAALRVDIDTLNVPADAEVRNELVTFSYTDFAWIFSTEGTGSTFKRNINGYADNTNSAESADHRIVQLYINEGTENASKIAFEYKMSESDFDMESGITVMAEYTQAFFDFYFQYASQNVDGDWEESAPSNFAQNKPASIDRKILNLQETRQLSSITVKATDYYKFINNGGILTFARYTASGSYYDVKVELIDGTVTNPERDTEGNEIPYDYNAFYNNLSRNFSGNVNSTGGVTINLGDSVLPGHYNITFICTDVLYTLNYETKFVSAENTLLEQMEKEDKSTYQNLGIKDQRDYEKFINLTYQGETPAGDRQEVAVEKDASTTRVYQDNKLKFNDTISLRVEESKESAPYSFFGWYIRNSVGSWFIQSVRAQEGTISSFFRTTNFKGVGSVDTHSLGDNSLTIFAVYTVKQAEISIDRNALIQNYNGEEIDRQFTLASLNIAGIYSGLTYVYNDVNGVEDQRVSFANSNVNGYDIVGFNILDANRQVCEIDKEIGFTSNEETGALSVVLNNMAEILDAIIETQPSLRGQYTLQPIIKQRTAQIVLHSGTGDSENEYGDKMKGEVYDLGGNLVSNTTYTTGTIYFGQSIMFNDELTFVVNDGESSLTSTISALFPTRRGYSKAYDIWMWGTSTTRGQSARSFSFNIDSYLNRDSENNIHLWRSWTANRYQITFDAGKGQFSRDAQTGMAGSTRVITLEYDGVVGLSNVPNQPTSVDYDGYKLVDWSLDDITFFTKVENSMIFGSDGTLTGLEDWFYMDNGLTRFRATENIRLSATWQAKEYKVRVMFNSGVYTSESREETTEREYVVTYDTDFSKVLLGSGDLIGGNPIRDRFLFNGLYPIASDGTVLSRIEKDTPFNSSTLRTFSFVNEGEIALTLFVGWAYDSEGNPYKFDLTNKTHEALIYNGNPQSILLTDYLFNAEEENFTPDMVSGFVVSHEAPLIALEDDSTVSMSYTLNDVISGESFSVKDAGNYQIQLLITLTDKAEYIPSANLPQFSIWLRVTVEKASVTLNRLSTANAVFAQKLMSQYLSAEENDKLTAELGSQYLLSDFVKFVKENEARRFLSTKEITQTDDEFVEEYVRENFEDDVVDEDILNYVVTKYYLMTLTNDGQAYVTYKDWTYSTFLSGYATLGNNAQTIRDIKSRMMYFDFYNNETFGTGRVTPFFNNQREKVFAFDSDLTSRMLQTSEIKLVSSGALQPRNSYEIRAYISPKGGENLSNYDLLSDDNGYYVRVGTAYVLPQILTVQNLTNQTQVFHSDSYRTREVSWVGEGAVNDDLKLIYDRDYYQAGENLFVAFNAFTSGSGTQGKDTNFTYKDAENYIYLSDVNVQMRVSEGLYRDVTSSYKLAMDDAFVFTILSTNGVTHINVTAKIYTTENNRIIYEDVSSASNLLNFVELYYNLTGSGEDSKLDDLTGPLVASDGTYLGQIEVNNANQISMFVNNAVTKVVITTSQRNLPDSQYVSLYEWGEGMVYGIEHEMEQSLVYTWQNSRSEDSQGLVETYINATYTDLVGVHYNLNFPEDYESESITRTTIKLGESTIDDLDKPIETGFVLKTLKYTTASNTEIDYSELFDADGVYRGYDKANPYAIINLTAYWALPDSLEYTTVHEGDYKYKDSVYSFTSGWTIGDVISVQNVNNSLYDYSISWNKDGVETPVSTTESFTLENKGSASESGIYNLIITATIKNEFLNSLYRDGEDVISSISCNYQFELEFVRYKLVSAVPNRQTSVYSSLDQKLSWQVSASYYIYDKNLEGYSTNVADIKTETIDFNVKDLASVTVLFDGNSVDSMTNAGVYNVSVEFNQDMFDVSESVPSGVFNFNYTITPATFNLTTDFVATKIFNTFVGETDIQQSATHATTREIVPLILTREANEDIGTYNLYFKDIDQEYKKNYIFVKDGVELFKDGLATENARTTAVGGFTILKSGGLSVVFEDDAVNPKIVSYSQDGYTLNLTDDFVLQIFNGGATPIEEYQLTLFDKTNQAAITSDLILNILKTKINDIQAVFYNSSVYEKAIVSGTYNYQFVTGDEYAKYFTSFEVPTNYEFIIERIGINISESTIINKTYDGTNIAYLDTNGEVTTPNNDEIYVIATFLDGSHVGNNLRVSLTLSGNPSLLPNYTLTTTSIRGNINPLDAVITFEMTQNAYAYGEVSRNNLSSLVVRKSVLSDGKDVSGILTPGNYEISYSVSRVDGQTVQTNSRDFYFVGDYKLEVDGDFDDFNMTIETSNFTIQKKNIVKEIVEDYLRVSILDNVTLPLTDAYRDEVTGDELTLNYNVDGLTLVSGKPSAVGQYNLSLANVVGANGIVDNFNVSISPATNNNGFRVLPADKTLFLKISNTDILNQIYNGKTYTISASNSGITISDGVNVYTSGLELYTGTAEDSEKVSDVTFTDISIYYSNGSEEITSFTTSGSYRLNLRATTDNGNYTTIVLYSSYTLEIGKKEISVTTIEKTYDGRQSASLTLTEADGIIGTDEVSVSATFSSANAGENLDVYLTLSGKDSINYKLKAETIKGNINKAKAELRFTGDTNVVFGSISNRHEFEFEVYVGSEELSASQYKIDITVENTSGAALAYSQQNYLNAGTYKVSFTADETATRNYTIDTVVISSFVIAPRAIDVEFNVAGEIIKVLGDASLSTSIITGYHYLTPLYEEIELTLTREVGNVVGYYKILSAKVAEGKTYSGNYIVQSCKDNSTGAFRIVLPNQNLYVLLGADNIINEADYNGLITVEYDGKVYDSASISGDAASGYKLVFFNHENSSIRIERAISFYTYDSDTSRYTKYDNVAGLKTDLRFYRVVTKNVGQYAMYATDTTSDGYEVKMGLAGETTCFTLNIVSKTIRLSDMILTQNANGSKTFEREFTNSKAQYIFSENETEGMLSGLVDGETVTLSITMKTTDGQVAKYVTPSSDYVLEASIGGQASANYTLDYEGITGRITPANLYVNVNNQTYTYGEITSGDEIPYTLNADESVIDFEGYLKTDRIHLSLVADGTLSTAGFLISGTHSMVLLDYGHDDFKISYIVNGQSRDDIRSAQIVIQKKNLTLGEKDIPLQEIFTKRYDGTTNVAFKDEADVLKFTLENVVSGTTYTDDVYVTDARFTTSAVRNPVNVHFELDGNDKDNYILADYQFGVINAVKVGIHFNTNASAGDDISTIGGGAVSDFDMNYPFASNNSLSSNADGNIEFPRSLVGKVGHDFVNWVLKFNNIQENSLQHNYITNITRNMNASYSNGVFTVVVDNNSQTLALINSLLSDSNDTLGQYYFLEHEKIDFTFEAVWERNKLKVSVNILDENGKALPAEYNVATVTLDGKEIVGNSVEKSYEFDDSLTINITSVNENCMLYGFYLGDSRIVPNTNFTLTQNSLTVNKIGEEYKINIRFSIKKIIITLDLQGQDATASGKDFESDGQGRYVYRTNHFDIVGKTLQDLYDLAGISAYGQQLSTLILGDKRFTETELKNTITSALPTTPQGIDIRISMRIEFERVEVEVTLNFGYTDESGNQISEIIKVRYGDAYGTAEGWKEKLEGRTGFDFIQWKTSDNTVVTGQSTMNKVAPHTLTAVWEKKKISVELVYANATLSNFTVNDVVSHNGRYVISNVEYQTSFNFMATPNAGYHLSTTWPNGFNILQTMENGAMRLSFTVPEDNCSFNIPVLANDNTVTVGGDNLQTLEVFGSNNEEISVVDGKFVVKTGQSFRIVASAKKGFEMTDEVTLSQEGLAPRTSLSDGVLLVNFAGVVSDVSVTLHAKPRENTITINFSDNAEVEKLEARGITYNTIANPMTFKVSTGETFTFQIGYKHGYTYGEYQKSDNLLVDVDTVETGDFAGYFKFDLSNIEDDEEITINSQKVKYTLTVQVVTFDKENNEVTIAGNRAFVDGQVGSGEVEFNTSARLTIEKMTGFSFAGWRKENEVNLFNTHEVLDYTVTEDETIYAVFSEGAYVISLGTVNHYTLFAEYNTPEKTQEIYSNFNGGIFFENGLEISAPAMIRLDYGTVKTIEFEVPEGYLYTGFGYRDNTDNFVQVVREVKEPDANGRVQIQVSGRQLGSDVNMLYVVIEARMIVVNVSSQINIDGKIEADINEVGHIEIQTNDAQVNKYGFIEGTRIQYSRDDFVNGELLSNSHFTVLAYTADSFQLKISAGKNGYAFEDISWNRNDVSIYEISRNEEFVVYEILALVGSANAEILDINVNFRPKLNTVDLSFTQNGEKVDGGAIYVKTDEDNKNKVWTSGNRLSQVTVSAYTDSLFEVIVYIKAGFTFDEEINQIYDIANLIVPESVVYEALSIENTGFSGKVRFLVSGFTDENEISVELTPSTYTVVFKDGDKELVKVHNVQFNTEIDITRANENNIEIIDVDNIGYDVNGKLNLVFKKEKFVYQGFFTRENGAGVQYINSSGDTNGNWEESGYTLNSITPTKYVVSDNATTNELGEIEEISLYLYMSYLKTRISFSFNPNVNTNATAQDMVEGVDYYNSWFYITSPMYIEVSFDTNIQIKAPEVAGYKFYKFVIKQKRADGIWLEDVESYLSSIPWTTDEGDNVVECLVSIYYFEKINVTIQGGEGSFELSQTGSNNQAKALLEEGYYDSSKLVTITAKPSDGYELTSWTNRATGVTTTLSSMDIPANGRKPNLLMTLHGKPVTLYFNYTNTRGRLTRVDIEEFNGATSSDTLTNNRTTVKVGDKVTFVMLVDAGFSTTWNRNDIEYFGYANGYHYFTMNITPEMADGNEVVLTPTFASGVLSFFVNERFNQVLSNATDMNSPSFAGKVTYLDREVRNFTAPCGENASDIQIGVVANARYEITKIEITNYDLKLTNMDNFFVDNQIVLTKDFIKANNIEGTVGILIEYKRLLWEEELLENSTFEGDGSSQNPYQIRNVEDLILLMRLSNSGAFAESGIRYCDAYYIVTADINLSEKFWTPIGTLLYPFNGKFNFNGHRITGIYTATFYSTISYNGLFGVLGRSAQITTAQTSMWYIYLIIGLVILLIAILIIVFYINRKRKKTREELAKR